MTEPDDNPEITDVAEYTDLVINWQDINEDGVTARRAEIPGRITVTRTKEDNA